MKRGAPTTDRLLTLILGLVFVASGVGMAAWQLDRLPFDLDSLDSSTVDTTLGQSWWPWALGGGAVVIALLGLTLLVRQFPARGPRSLTSVRDGSAGSVTLEASALVARVGDLASDIDGVRSARARTVVDRRQPVVQISATMDRTADPVAVVEALSQVRAGVADVMGSDSAVAVRVVLDAR